MATKRAKPITFKLHGKPFDPTGSAAIFAKLGIIQAHLNRSETGDVFDATEIGDKCNISSRSLADYSAKLREGGYAVKIGQRNFYGNKDTIAGLKQTMEA